jgi:hypothetical protein
MPIERADLRAVSDLDAAARLFRALGYTAKPTRIDPSALGIENLPKNLLLRAGQRSREGYAVFLAEAPQFPRSLAAFGRSLRERLHDDPLAVLGVPGRDGRWERFVVVRPRAVQTSGRIAYRAAKIEVLVGSPTRHDAEVLEGLRWWDGDTEAQRRVDEAFDVEAVTKRFFVGLREHFDRLEAALDEAGRRQPHIVAALDLGGGARRVAIRLVSQVLFCWFLQRKGLLAGDRDYLLSRWRRHRGDYYATELEPLFYEALALPVDRRPPGRPGHEIPFLNGGLFHRAYGDVSLPVPDELLGEDAGLLGYLAGWTFTLSEESPDEVDVAVDPELLGRVFENLISDDEQSRYGVVYTPRPVVQFMCREALAMHLERAVALPEAWCRRLLTDDTAFEGYGLEHGSRAVLDLCWRLETALDNLRILDPAVGSGAFLLGMLAEIVRLRTLAHVAAHGSAPDGATLRSWKLACIERTLFGVDIEPLALELCRLRLWLALIVDVAPGEPVPALPNLEHRTIPADSLTDFVGGVEVQNTRGGARPVSEQSFLLVVGEIEPLRTRFFYAADPEEKARVREELAARENRLVEEVLDLASEGAAGQPTEEREARRAYVAESRRRFASADRVFPIFVPAFHAPEVLARGGWDIVIMNPPYLGKKQVAQKVREGKIEASRQRDWERHHGESTDLMILFGYRARELVRPGGVCSVIFQDSLFTSTDAQKLRQILWDSDTVQVMARTRCFEGKAVNGGVVVWRREAAISGNGIVRWVEGYRRDPRDFAAACEPLDGDAEQPFRTGEMEVWRVERRHYMVLPSRPLFRPAPVALWMVERFAALHPPEVRRPEGWNQLSNTRQLNRLIGDLRRTGWFERLRPGQLVPLGYCIVGGQGLATADDRFFLAAIKGTDEAAECAEAQARLLRQIAAVPHLNAMPFR